jgi:hypothetical protein
LKRWPALVVGAAFVTLARPADADESTRATRSRVLAGLGTGITSTSLSIDGRSGNAQGGVFVASLEAGYAHDFSGSRWGLGALVRFGNWPDDWTAESGETRQRLELHVAPEFRIRRDGAPVKVEVVLSLGGGPSFAFFQPARHRALREEYGVGTGFHFGPRGIALFSLRERLGIYLGSDFAYYAIWVRHRAEIASAGLSATSRYRYSGLDLMARGGFAYAF